MQRETNRVQDTQENGERRGNQQALLNNALEAVEQARRFDIARLPTALCSCAQLLLQDGHFDQAREIAQEILQIEQASPNAVEANIVLGVCAAQRNRLDEAENWFHLAADTSRRISDLSGLARSMQCLAHYVLIIRGKFHLALTNLEEASLLREEKGDKFWQETFFSGLIYQIQGKRRQCRKVLDDLVLQVEPGTQLAAAYYLLWARLAMDEEELEQADQYLNLGLRIANRIGTMDLNLWLRLAYSRYHRKTNEAPVARSWAEDALHLAQRYGSQYFTGLALIERAQCFWEAGDSTSAQDDLAEALRTLQPLNAAFDLALACYLRALWNRQSGHPEAEAAWLEAVQRITRDGYPIILEKEQDQAFPLVAAHLRSKSPAVRSATESLMRHLANVPPPPLRIAALGQFAIWKGRRRIPDQAWNRRKAGELLRYLLLQPNRSAGREVIIEALWPDHTSDNLADLLHQSTSALRHALEPDLPDKFPSRYLKVEGEQISLLLPPDSVVDFVQFERALPLAIQGRSIDRLQEALSLYSGELFPSDRYADWSTEKRLALAELHQRGMLTLAAIYLKQGQHLNVVNAVRHVLRIDSWNEDAVLLGMQAYMELRDVPHALQLYRLLEKTLKDELGIAPRSDLSALAETLQKR